MRIEDYALIGDLQTAASSTVNDQLSPALGTVTVPASCQPDSSATPSCGSAMNPSSDIVSARRPCPSGTSCRWLA